MLEKQSLLLTDALAEPASEKSGDEELTAPAATLCEEDEVLQAAAAVATERIQLIYGAYLDAGTEPEETFTLEVSGAAPGSNAVTIKAMIANMLNGKYPRNFYRSDKFPGLRR